MLGKLLDRFCFNTIFLFIAVVVILGGKLFSPKNEAPDMKKGREDMTQSAHILPKTVGTWTGSPSPRIVTDENIFDYMDGAGELYLGYRFDHLEVYEYRSQVQEDILVELYFMESSDDAFGLLSLDWGGEPVDLDPSSRDGGPFEAKDHDGSGWPEALYGEGLLRLRSDDIYARIMATQETPESRQAVLSLGRSIAKGQAASAPPSLLKEFPESFLPNWEILRERLAYFRSHLVLNSIYYLSQENILDLGPDCEAATALYQRQDPPGRARLRLLLVIYPDRDRANNAVIHFQQGYLPELPPAKVQNISEGTRNIVAVEDGWLAYRVRNRSLIFVFECPDQETAGALIDRIK
jgi:hypothetical protein